LKIASTQFSLETNSFEIYLSGCNGAPKCQGCHNAELWDFDVGAEYNEKMVTRIKNKLFRFSKLINKIFILGGEPLDQNIEELESLLNALSETKKEIFLFTRYNLNKIPENIKQYCDYIKCGKYIKNLETQDNIQYSIKLATSNQKIYKKGLDY